MAKPTLRIARRRRPAVAMELGPMIDCVFQLLIFFMLSTTFLTPALRLTLPEASNDQMEAPPDVVVSVDAEGRLFINRDPTKLTTLQADLAAALALADQPVVTIRCDERAPHKFFLQVLAAAKASGAAAVNVAHNTQQVAE